VRDALPVALVLAFRRTSPSWARAVLEKHGRVKAALRECTEEEVSSASPGRPQGGGAVRLR
jgi:hypothetical protein